MPRADWEAELARKLGRLSQKQLNRLMRDLGDPPNLDNLNPEIWNEFSTEMRGELAPALEQIFLDSAQTMLDETPSIGVDWELVNEAAANWARQYTFDLVNGITANTQSALREKISNFYEESQTIPQLSKSLETLFGPVRAEMIAVTEATRAAVQGQAGLVNELNKQGLEMEPFFITSEDETVCPICSPLNNKRVNESQFPPLHPRCRCDIAYRFAKN